MSIDKLIMGNALCTKCGARYGQCDCWTKCDCGWLYESGSKCRNPECGGTGQRQVVASSRKSKKR